MGAIIAPIISVNGIERTVETDYVVVVVGIGNLE